MPPPPIPSEQLTSDSNKKLTKKQLKSLAFKQGKNPGKSVSEALENDGIDVETDLDHPSTSTSTSIVDQDAKQKQKKKEKKKKEEKGKGSRLIPDGGDLPQMDQDEDEDHQQNQDQDQDQAKSESKTSESKPNSKKKDEGESKNEAKRKAKAEKKLNRKLDQGESQSESKKRKREELVDEQDDEAANKKKLTQDGEKVKVEEKKGKGKEKEKEKVDEKKKLILFVGNMSFKVTSQQLASHFSSTCGETPTVRLLTKKLDPNSSQAQMQLSASKLKSIEKGKAADPRKKEVSKGCAFLEFKKTDSVQKALRFHHTLFEGRVINVELTAGGGGKGENRREKIEKKNKALDEERAKIHSKYIGPANEAQKAAPKKEPPRKKVDEFGVGEAQWGPRGAGGESNSKPQSGKEKRNAKWSATGVNSVRLGN